MTDAFACGELGSAFVALVLLFDSNSWCASGSFEIGVIGVRVGDSFAEGPIAPWISFGVGSANETITTSEDGGTPTTS